MIERHDLDGSKSPHFVSCWTCGDTSVSDGLIEFFESNPDLHVQGSQGGQKVNKAIKDSTDITVYPLDLEEQKYQAVSVYMEHLRECYLDYLEQWEFLKTFLTRVHVGPFNIQKYEEGGHFGELHSERTSLNCLHRTLVWMTYLNDVESGGETEFPMFGLKVKPEKGKTLIWPAEWTHAHFGGVVEKGNKYIITGWMHFPDDVDDPMLEFS